MKKKNMVGDNIRRLRIAAGITQEELALRCGLSQGYINQLESGKRRFTQKSLEKIRESLSVPITEMFKGEDTYQAPAAKETTFIYGKKTVDKKEVLALLKELPAHITEHYLTLMRMEKELWKNSHKRNKVDRFI